MIRSSCTSSFEWSPIREKNASAVQIVQFHQLKASVIFCFGFCCLNGAQNEFKKLFHCNVRSCKRTEDTTVLKNFWSSEQWTIQGRKKEQQGGKLSSRKPIIYKITYFLITKRQVVMGSKLAGLADVGDHFQSIYIPVPNNQSTEKYRQLV